MKFLVIFLFILAFYLLTVLLARWVNRAMVKRLPNAEVFVGVWFIPFVNLIFIFVETAEVLYKWNGSGRPSRFSRMIDRFAGKTWKYEDLDPDTEQILNGISIKEIEQYLRKKKLKKLK